MRGSDARSGSLFSYVDLEERIPARHPLRLIKAIVDEVLVALDGAFAELYEGTGRSSVAPERLLRASLLQAFYSVRSERQLMEQIDYNLLFRWFVGLGVDDPVWDHSTFSKNRDRPPQQATRPVTEETILPVPLNIATAKSPMSSVRYERSSSIPTWHRLGFLAPS